MSGRGQDLGEEAGQGAMAREFGFQQLKSWQPGGHVAAPVRGDRCESRSWRAAGKESKRSQAGGSFMGLPPSPSNVQHPTFISRPWAAAAPRGKMLLSSRLLAWGSW